MTEDRITVEALVRAPIGKVWQAYVAPEHVTQWNFASEDWHCPRASADLRPGGRFSARMEAKDGSAGFDFEGIYTRILPEERIEYEFGGRRAEIDFQPEGGSVRVRVTFDPENEYPREHQQAGWQAILDNFARHAEKL